MKKFFITALIALGFACSMSAQDISFTIVKNDGTSTSYTMSSNAKIYCSDTQLFLDSNGETVTYNLSDLRKAYFSVLDEIVETENQQLSIYPNPVKEILRITNIPDNHSVTIYSIDGKAVKKIEVSESAEINVSDLKSGLYIIGVGNEFSKFIKM